MTLEQVHRFIANDRNFGWIKICFQIGVPSVLSFMSTGNFDGVVEGVNDLEAKYDQQYGPGDYTPNVPLAYWSFRLMIGFGAIASLFMLLALWQMRRGGTPTR